MLYAGERVAGAGEGAGEEEHGEREEEGEQAGEGGAALGALEGRARDVDAEAVLRHDADHAGVRWKGLEWTGMRRAIFYFCFSFIFAKGHYECGAVYVVGAVGAVRVGI